MATTEYRHLAHKRTKEYNVDYSKHDDQILQSGEHSNLRLTTWKKEPTIADLKADLDLAKPAHNGQVQKITDWNHLLNVTGKSRPAKVKGRSSVQPKLIRRQAEWRYSALTEPFLGNGKIFSVKPRTFEDKKSSEQNELVLNHQFNTKLNKVKLVDDYVRSTVDDGSSITQVGWERSTVMIKEDTPVYSYYPITSEEQLEPLKQAIDLKAADPRTYSEQVPEDIQEAVNFYLETGQPVIAMVTGSEKVEVEKIIENKPTVTIHDPTNVVIDPSCNGDLNKALFVVVSFDTHKAALQKQGDRYSNLDKVNWESAASPSVPDHNSKTPSEFQFKDVARKQVVAYEYWGFYDIDGKGELTSFVASWIGDTLIRMEKNPFPDGKLPFVLVPYLPVKRELYGETDAELLEDNQNIQGAVIRGMIDVMGKSANGQIGMAKGLLDPLNKRRYENGQDYEFNPNGNPLSNIINHVYPEIPGSAMTMVNLMNQEAESLSGTKSFGGGLSGEAYGDVAAGIRGMLDAASKREMAILRRLAKGMVEIGEKIAAMNAVFLSEKEIIRITNDEFVSINREDLKGNFDLIVDISTAEIDNAQSQDLGFMLQTMGPSMDPSISMEVLAEIAELKRMPDLANKLRNYKPQPSPEQQQLAQLEVALKQAEVDLILSEIELNRAKAKKENSEADLKDLDFVEGETGTKHARDMEKQKAQSQGNQNLEVTKAFTKARKDNESNPNIEAAIGFNQLSDTLASAGTNGNTPQVNQALPPYSVGSGYVNPNVNL